VLSDIQILIAPLVSFGHCVIWYTDSEYPFSIFCQKIPKGNSESVYQTTQWPKDTKGAIRICISDSPLVSFGHCVVCCTDSEYPLVSFGHCVVWYTDYDCPFGIFWPKDTKGEIRICITDNTMAKRYQRGNQNLYIIFWPLCCLLYRFWLPFGFFW
jgi:hypothetical protein